MAFNFAHLLSAACGGAPRRLGRLRRPWARCARLFLEGCEHRKIALLSHILVQRASGGLPVLVLARASPHLCRACLL